MCALSLQGAGYLALPLAEINCKKGLHHVICNFKKSGYVFLLLAPYNNVLTFGKSA